MLKNVLIVVDDIEKSIEFYKDLFGLQVILQNEGNVILSEGLVLQDAGLSVSYTHLRAHETDSYLVCRLLLEKKKN